MKIRYYILFALLFMHISCSSEADPDQPPKDELDLTIESSSNSYEIDKLVSFVVKSDQNIKEVCISIDNWESRYCQISSDATGLGLAKTVIMSFDKLGTQTVNVKIENYTGQKKETSFQIEIVRGTAVKINRITINSFKDIDGSWDPEYESDNINRLADLKFAFRKNYITTTFDEMEYASKVWYISEVLMNQGNLTWDLNSLELYIDPNLNLRFGLGDDDGGGIAQDLLLGPPFDLDIGLKDHILEKPTTITLQQSDIDLEVVFEIEW